VTAATDPGRAVRWTVVAALGAALALSVPIAARQWTIAREEAWAARDLGGDAPPLWLPRPRSVCGEGCPAAARIASAVSLAAQADSLAAPALRKAAYRDADQQLSAALASQPASGSGWNWLAYVRLREGRTMAAVCEALARSYEAAPFLIKEGPWRARIAAVNWDLLSPRTRDRVVDETVWLRDVNPAAFGAVAPAFTDPDAVRALAQALRQPPSVAVPHRWSGAPGGVGAAHH
jgi:hypothetical protein